MSDFGFSCTNKNSTVLFSTADMNLKLIKHGTIYSASNVVATGKFSYGKAGYRIIIPQPVNTALHKCLVFIQPLARYVAPDSRKRGVGAVNGLFYVTDTPNAAFKYMVFYPGNMDGFEHPEPWGMELYNEKGEKTFSTNQEIMDIVDTVLMRFARYPFYYTLEHAYAPGAFYCLHLGDMCERFEPDDVESSNGVLYRQALKQISNTSADGDGYVSYTRGLNELEYWERYDDITGQLGTEVTFVMKDPLIQ